MANNAEGSVNGVVTAGCCHPPLAERSPKFCCSILHCPPPLAPLPQPPSPLDSSGASRDGESRGIGDSKGIAAREEASSGGSEQGKTLEAFLMPSRCSAAGACFCSLVGGFPLAEALHLDTGSFLARSIVAEIVA